MNYTYFSAVTFFGTILLLVGNVVCQTQQTQQAQPAINSSVATQSPPAIQLPNVSESNQVPISGSVPIPVQKLKSIQAPDLPSSLPGSPPKEQVIEEIKALRKQMGGGIAEQLKGLGKNDPNWDQEIEVEFENELNRLNRNRDAMPNRFPGNPKRNQHSSNSIRPNVTSVPSATAVRSRWPVARSPVARSPNEAPQLGLNHPVNIPSSVISQPELLRESASKLDQMAAQFEKSELYEEADKIREQARKFWIKAREMNQSNDDE